MIEVIKWWNSIADALAKVYEPERLQRAWRHVRKNAGVTGIDQMTIEAFAERKDTLLTQIHDKLLSGIYQFKPARQAEIPKEEASKTRKLGIPVVMDCIVGTSMHLMMEEYFDPDVTDSNSGNRKGRSQLQARGPPFTGYVNALIATEKLQS